MGIEVIKSEKIPAQYNITLSLEEDDYEMIMCSRNALLDQTCEDDYLIELLKIIMDGCK